jgi:uncharacterized membrane protein YbhN (UPF0104 family)
MSLLRPQRGAMRALGERPVHVMLLAIAIAAVVVVMVAAIFGFPAFERRWSHLHLGWLALVICSELVALQAYALAYRSMACFAGGPQLSPSLALGIVLAGFGPQVLEGGFVLDKRALHAVQGDERSATVRVLGLGALEWALLAPAAWIAALVLLANSDRRAMASVLWPWAIAAPLGFALGLWLAAPRRRQRLSAGSGWWREPLGKLLAGVGILAPLARSFTRYWPAWIGMTLYWTLDITALYGALRFVGLSPNAAEVLLAYATGYALTRRSLPLAGAGVTEALMTFALHWVGQPIGPSLAAVVVYRVFNFVLPAVPAFLVRRRVSPLLAAAAGDRGQT